MNGTAQRSVGLENEHCVPGVPNLGILFVFADAFCIQYFFHVHVYGSRGIFRDWMGKVFVESGCLVFSDDPVAHWRAILRITLSCQPICPSVECLSSYQYYYFPSTSSPFSNFKDWDKSIHASTQHGTNLISCCNDE